MSSPSTAPAGSPALVLYDGACGLCNRLVRFVLKRDARDRFRFASLQSPYAQQALAPHGINSADLNTVYLMVDHGEPQERLLRKSAAILEIVRRLGGVWTLGGVLEFLPQWLADALYDLVARHRYQIFGKHDTCPLPTPAERRKFLDAEEQPPPVITTGELAAELARICGEAYVFEDAATLETCTIDGVVPRAVVEPGTADEIAAILKFATARRLAVVPAGGPAHQHTGAKLQAVDIVLRTARLNTMEFGDNQVRVGAGVAIIDLKIRLAESGAIVPIEAEDETTVGGALAVASEGPLRQGYGSLRECCIGMTFVAADGEICTVPGAVPGKLAGFDLIRLMIGSYGSLGVIVEASLKVFPLPEQTRTFVAKFLLANGALQFRDRVLRSALRPMCLELASPRASEFLDRPEQTWNLYIRFSGKDAVLAGYRADIGGETYVKEELEGEAEGLIWAALSYFEHAIITRHANAMTVRVSVPVDDVARAIHAAEKIATANNFLCAQIGRVGVGSLEIAFIPLGAPITTQYASTVSALRAAISSRGSSVVARCPAEVKPLLQVWGLPPGEVKVLRHAKKIMDPGEVLSPSRFVL